MHLHQSEEVDAQPTNLIPSKRVNSLPGSGPGPGPGSGPSNSQSDGHALFGNQRSSLDVDYGSITADLSQSLPHEQYRLASKRTDRQFPGKPLNLSNTVSLPEYPYHERLGTSSPSQRIPSTANLGPPKHSSYLMLRQENPLEEGTASPRLDRLPSFHQLSKIADGGTEPVEPRATVLPSLTTYAGTIMPQSATTSHPQFSPSQHSSPSAHFLALGHPSPTNTRNGNHEVYVSRSPAAFPGPPIVHNPRRSSPVSNRRPPFITSSSSGDTALSRHSSGADSYSTCHTTPQETTPSSLDGTPRASIPGFSRQHSSTSAPGGFVCDHAGCTAPPFQTQYLLNSHANVHSSSRPHYCPVKGCSRAEGGKGFKRKNEMIRHGLVHDSPGYVCPFCPLREHKYPRPDNLQRHVRVHHVDKDKDDPLLREVLAQRPEGGGRGRRKRAGPA